MEEFKFRMGEGVQDQISGFKGKIISQKRDITGPDQFLVQSTGSEAITTMTFNSQWFDEGRLKLTETGGISDKAVDKMKSNSVKTGENKQKQ